MDMAGVSTSWMNPAHVYDGTRNHLEYAPGVPMAFTASFYSGLGPMLVVAALRFLLELWHFANKNML